jgi:hypothetical protein
MSGVRRDERDAVARVFGLRVFFGMGVTLVKSSLRFADVIQV